MTEIDFDAPYVFTEKPAAKSSTGVLVSVPAEIACQQCGCRAAAIHKNYMSHKKGCTCKCHTK